ACYQRGGDKPTVTDADLALGRLDPDEFAGGSIVLSAKASGDALSSEIGTTLDMDGATSAFAVCEVVDENMANAARVHAVENGEDLSGYSMIAFGGAAPLHAGRLCEKLGIGKVLIPPGAGVGSAIGFLKAPFSFEATRSIYQRLSSFQPDAVRRLFADLKAEATQFVRTCDPTSEIVYDYKAYVRYVGQGWEIPVELSEANTLSPDTGELLGLFEKQYEILFGRTVEGLDVEVTSWSINAATPVEAAEPVSASSAGEGAKADGTRQLFDPAAGGYVEAKVVDRTSMAAGHHVEGPAIITEAETTIIVPSGFTAIGQPDGCIELTRLEEQAS
ncbi:MAG: hydantoinase/oxoprolinase family protein, partial [Hyphomicrobiales bacterium]|nr:hydantoinase/oxoprolinase family protein [Hyphomicrobiales bacterium]